MWLKPFGIAKFTPIICEPPTSCIPCIKTVCCTLDLLWILFHIIRGRQLQTINSFTREMRSFVSFAGIITTDFLKPDQN